MLHDGKRSCKKNRRMPRVLDKHKLAKCALFLKQQILILLFANNTFVVIVFFYSS